jgi:hypothetical protein
VQKTPNGKLPAIEDGDVVMGELQRTMALG